MSSGAALTVIRAAPVKSRGATLLDPVGPAWNDVPRVTLGLVPTPLDRQPSHYIRVSRESVKYGTASLVECAAAVAGDELAINLIWPEPTPNDRITDNNVYADACAVLFPRDGETAELSTMGSPEHPVIAWHWRAGNESPQTISATGIGPVEAVENGGLLARGEWRTGSWHVSFVRPLQAPPFIPGATLPIGFAVWRAADGDRGGLKAHTDSWHRMVLA